MLFRRSFRSLILVLLCLSLCFASVCGKHHHKRHHKKHHRKRDTGPYHAVTGVPGKVHPRYEISDLFYNHPGQWNLYLLALQRMKAEHQGDKLSYFSISGIHGVPNVPWDGVGRESSGTGYCVHSSNLFPTWHRPYVALFEQRLGEFAKEIARNYPEGKLRRDYMASAAKLRHPYWDWAARPKDGRPSLPNLITEEFIGVRTPQGDQTIRNPLFRYAFHPFHSNVFPVEPWHEWPQTLRWPSSTAPNAYSVNGDAQETIHTRRPQQCASLYQWFTNCPGFLEMSNDESSSSHPGCSISLESLHNSIHVWIGGLESVGPGHMSVIPYSAFDPIFMLHHAQIDRLFAMWQAIYPHTFTPKQISQIDTFTIRKGSVQGAASPLTPFHRTSLGEFWTSNGVRNHRVFQYTYPELQTGDSPGHVRAAVNRLYGPSQQQNIGKRDLEGRNAATNSTSTSLLPIPTAGANIVTPCTASNGSTFQYIANIATTRFGLNGTYSVYIFLGKPASEHSSSWPLDQNTVGSYGVFSQPGMEENNIVTTSAVPLTIALQEKVSDGVLPALDEEYVVPYLTKELQWRVSGPESAVIDPASVPDFLITVVASTLPPVANEDEFPVWSPFITLPQITQGKQGGLHPRTPENLLPRNARMEEQYRSV